MLYSEQMHQICEKLGVKREDCKDGLYSTLLQAICDACEGGGGGEEWFNDGNTHIWISLPEGRTSPWLGGGVNGTVTVDWGDGTNPTVIRGTNTETFTSRRHDYEKPGEYVITLTTTGTLELSGDTNGGYLLLKEGTNGSSNIGGYRNSVKKVEIGSGVNIGKSAFRNFACLSDVVIGDGVPSIGGSAFGSTTRLSTVVVAGSVQSIQSHAFDGSFITYFDFSHHTVVPSLVGVLQTWNMNDWEIRVPAALVDEWKAATNWATYADKIVGV